MQDLIWAGLIFFWAAVALSTMALLSRKSAWHFAGQGLVAMGLGSFFLAWIQGKIPLSGMRGLCVLYLFFAFFLALVFSLRLQLGEIFPLLVALPTGVSFFFAAWAPMWSHPLPGGSWHALHLVCMAASFAALSLAWTSALIVHLQLRILKSKRLGFWWDRLPSLQALDRTSYRSLQLAFFCLGGLVLSGFLQRSIPAVTGARTPRLLAGGILWLVVGVAMHGRAVMGISAKRLAWASLLVFALAVLVALYLLLGAQVPVRW